MNLRVPLYTIILYLILLSIGIIGTSVYPSILSYFYIVDICLVFFFLFALEHKNFDSLYIYFTRKEAILFSVTFLLGFMFVLANVGIGILIHAFILVYAYLVASYALMALPVAIIMQFIIASIEEITFRGYIMYDLEKYYSRSVSVIVSSILFSFLHIIAYSEGVLPEYSVLTTFFFFTNMFLGGIILAMLKLRTKTLASAIGFHMAWNFFGYHIFGLSSYPSFYKVYYYMPYYISGFEIGVITFLVLFVFLVILFFPFQQFKNKKLN